MSNTEKLIDEKRDRRRKNAFDNYFSPAPSWEALDRKFKVGPDGYLVLRRPTQETLNQSTFELVQSKAGERPRTHKGQVSLGKKRYSEVKVLIYLARGYWPLGPFTYKTGNRDPFLENVVDQNEEFREFLTREEVEKYNTQNVFSHSPPPNQNPRFSAPSRDDLNVHIVPDDEVDDATLRARRLLRGQDS